MRVECNLRTDIDVNEFRKAICFLSEDINHFSIEDDRLILDLKEDSKEKGNLLASIDSMQEKYKLAKNQHTEYVYQRHDKEDFCECFDEEKIFEYDNGMVSLQEEALFLFQYFTKEFRKIAHSVGKHCEERIYPVLLPVKEYQKTGYIKRTPQYAMFCCSPYEEMNQLEELNSKVTSDSVKDMLNEPQYSLSPSACFHTYIQYKNKTIKENKLISFTQNVFRNEGRLNYSEFGRLRDYHVREIVLIGDENYVVTMRKKILDKAIEFMKLLNLDGEVSVAYDPFILPKMQKFKKIQMLEKSKYELKLNYEKEKQMSVASFNLHGTAFTEPFHISLEGQSQCVTGCVGFGIERWVLSFAAQYGLNPDNWPDVVREEYKKDEY